MKMYAELPGRRARQLLGDIWLVVWTAGWVWIAYTLHGLIMNLAAPGAALASGASDLASSMDSAGQSLSGVPLIGDGLSLPFDGMGQAARLMSAAGQAEVDAVSALAMFVAVAMAVLAFTSFAVFWIPIRIAFIRRAGAAQRFIDADEDLDLFALRALARQPLHILARIDSDPAGAWRRGDRRVTGALARLELQAEGLRPPMRQG